MRRLYLLACLAIAWAACGDEPVQKVQPSIRVEATHLDEDGSLLLDFGPVPVLLTRTLPLTITNLSRAPLSLHEVALDAGDGTVFTFDQDLSGTTLRGGESVELGVVFRPTEQAPFQGTIRVVSDDPQQGLVEVGVDGWGSTVGKAEIGPRHLDFGMVGEWTQEVRNVRIASVGTAPLLIESIELVEGSSPVFMVLGSTRPTELPPPADGVPGGEVLLPVACAPTAATEGETFEGQLRIVTTDPTQREVIVELTATVNRAPIADFTIDPSNHAPHLPVQLDATESYDPDGHEPLTYEWRIFRKPLGTTAEFDDPTSPTPTLIVSEPGDYEIGLDVFDSLGLACRPIEGSDLLPCAKQNLQVLSEDDLVITLAWTHPVTDLDLHLLDTGAELYSSRDCFWDNRTPDFGIPGDTSDDPRFTKESLKGFGPEEIVFSKPSDGTYTVMVDFAKANGAPDPLTDAILRVYVYGKLEAEMRATLELPGQVWEVLTIEWPSAAITEIDQVRWMPAP